MTDTLEDFHVTADMFTAADDREVRLAVSTLKARAPELCVTAPGSTGEIIMSESEFEGLVSMARRMFRQAAEARTAYENGVRGASCDDVDEAELARLREMMADPRYWRDQDPAITEEVRAGFERLYLSREEQPQAAE